MKMTENTWQVKRVRLEGVAPLLMRNGLFADQLYPWKLLMDIITSKKKKSEDDYKMLMYYDFMGSLYLAEDESGKPYPVIPSENIEAVIIAGAKKMRRGPNAKSSVFVNEHAPLEYDGPRDPEELFKDINFRDTRMVVVNRGSRVSRTRPVFKKWAIEFNVNYDKSMLSEYDLLEWLTLASYQVGLGDYRPKFGRFNVVEPLA